MAGWYILWQTMTSMRDCDRLAGTDCEAVAGCERLSLWQAGTDCGCGRLVDWQTAGWGRLWQAVTDCGRLGQTVAGYEIATGWLGQIVRLWQARLCIFVAFEWLEFCIFCV